MVYRVSAYVEHGSLRDNLSWFYDPREALGLMNQLTAALEYIHGQGYVHSNLKSSNIFLDEQSRPLSAGQCVSASETQREKPINS